MKLIFNKGKENQISVLQDIDGKQKEFSYIDMINSLIKSKKIKKPKISDGYTEAEVKSINSMISHINKKISESE